MYAAAVLWPDQCCHIHFDNFYSLPPEVIEALERGELSQAAVDARIAAGEFEKFFQFKTPADLPELAPALRWRRAPGWMVALLPAVARVSLLLAFVLGQLMAWVYARKPQNGRDQVQVRSQRRALNARAVRLPWVTYPKRHLDLFASVDDALLRSSEGLARRCSCQ